MMSFFGESGLSAISQRKDVPGIPVAMRHDPRDQFRGVSCTSGGEIYLQGKRIPLLQLAVNLHEVSKSQRNHGEACDGVKQVEQSKSGGMWGETA
jgi:hypothetical protein